MFVFGAAFAQEPTLTKVFQVNEVEFRGNGKTKEEALIEILPRDLPTEMTEVEIAEYSRRIKNLGIFDFVKVTKVDQKLIVELHRKTTLSPIVGLSTGKTIRDTSAALGLNEYDFLGNGTKLGGQVSYSDRNLNFDLWVDEHLYRHHRWSREVELYKRSSDFRFEDNEDITWKRNRLGGFFEWISPFKYDSPVLYEFQVQVYREDFSNVQAENNLESATYIGGLFEVIYDRYNWDDLHPHGFKGVFEFRPGAMTDGRFRGETLVKFLAAKPIGEKTSLVANGKAAVVNSGDVNHSLLIGSQAGVRGLSDSLYRTSALSYLNLEARHSMKVWERTYLQPVLFVDAARFRPMDFEGNNQAWINALSTGVGARLIPTGLTNVMFRADIARLHAPSEDWLLQIGITQYF